MPLCKCRADSQQTARRVARAQNKELKGLLTALVATAGGDGPERLRNAREAAFVITDLESSTAQAAACPAAFRKLQDIHDSVCDSSLTHAVCLPVCSPACTSIASAAALWHYYQGTLLPSQLVSSCGGLPQLFHSTVGHLAYLEGPEQMRCNPQLNHLFIKKRQVTRFKAQEIISLKHATGTARGFGTPRRT